MRLHIRWFIISFRRHYFLKSIILCFLFGWTCYIFIKLISETKTFTSTTLPVTSPTRFVEHSLQIKNKQTEAQKYYSDSEFRKKMFERKLQKLSQLIKKPRSVPFNNNSIPFPYYNVHIFYYAWYGNNKFDSDFYHWNHNYIPSWKKDDKIKVYPKHHEAPSDIGSNYYPQLGCYSSRDPEVIKTHMKQLNFVGSGVLVVSWTPPGMKDSPHDILPSLFYYASEQNLKITLHIEPYFNRNPENFRKHLMNFFDNYINHPALYKINGTTKSKSLPLIYVYDSYLTSFNEWKELLCVKGNISIRNTAYDAVFIGLLVEQQHRYHIKKSCFNGFYTYFASNSFTFGSTWKNWNSLSKFARQNHLMFIPSVGPGYIDTQVRPWNSVNTRHRRHGQYYDFAWRSAISSNVNYISITSFNEWHEGTQIEPAKSKSIPGFTYSDYNPEGSDFYLNLTKWWINNFFYSKHKY